MRKRVRQKRINNAMKDKRRENQKKKKRKIHAAGKHKSIQFYPSFFRRREEEKGIVRQ
jgi:hypothetical protein